MLLNLFAFLIIPGYTLLYVKNFNLFTVNFSVIGNLLGKKRAFVIWGFLMGIYFYFVLSSVSKNLRLSKRVRYLVHTALMLLFLAVFTPYLPQEFPFKAFLHIVFAMAASLCLIVYLFFASRRLLEVNRTAGECALWGLLGIFSISAILLVSVGIVSSALEIFFTFSAVFLSRFFLVQSKGILQAEAEQNIVAA